MPHISGTVSVWNYKVTSEWILCASRLFQVVGACFAHGGMARRFLFAHVKHWKVGNCPAVVLGSADMHAILRGLSTQHSGVTRMPLRLGASSCCWEEPGGVASRKELSTVYCLVEHAVFASVVFWATRNVQPVGLMSFFMPHPTLLSILLFISMGQLAVSC